MRTRGKRVAWLAGAVAIAVLVVVGIGNEKRIRERWWLYQLRNGDEESQRVAAEKLGELGSLKAIPALIGIHTRWGALIDWPGRALSRIAAHGDPKGLPLWLDALESGSDVIRIAAANAISPFAERAENAIPALIRAIKEKPTLLCPAPFKKPLWTAAAETLRQIGPKGKTALAAALNDLHPEARQVSEGFPADR